MNNRKLETSKGQ